MAQFEQHFVQDLTQPIKVRHCGTIVFNADDESNVISVRLFNGSEPVAISGSVVGAVVCSDGSTVTLSGSYSGNTASITLTGDCFAILGQIGVGIQIVNGTQKTTVLKAIYNVETLTTENVVDPGSRITLEVGDLIDDIETATAAIPASDMASLMSGIAPTFSDSVAYKAGAYVYYSGNLYCFTADHNGGTWTGSDVTAAVLCNDISDLKSTIMETSNIIKVNYFNPDTVTLDKSIDSSGNEQTSSGYCISDRINIPSGKTKAVISYTGANGEQAKPNTYSRAGAYYYASDGSKVGSGYAAHNIPSGAAYAVLTLNATYAANEARRRVMYEFADDISGFVPYTDITAYSGGAEKNHFNLWAEIVNNAPQIKLIGDSIMQGVGGTGFEQDGDLIFDGGGSSVWHVNTSGYCWANEFKTHVEAISNATVKNWGCRGISTADVMILDMLPTLIENDDDIVIVMLGTNDRKETQIAPVNADLAYQSNLKAICNYIISRGKKLVLLSPIPATPSADDETGVHFKSNVVNLVCSSVANQIGCIYYDLFSGFVDWILTKNIDYSTLYNDVLHPNDKGYELIYYLVCKGLHIPNDLTFSFVK